MGHSNVWNSHPKTYSPDSRTCSVCGKSRGLIRKYALMCCRQCFRTNAKEIGFIKVASLIISLLIYIYKKSIERCSSSTVIVPVQTKIALISKHISNKEFTIKILEGIFSRPLAFNVALLGKEVYCDCGIQSYKQTSTLTPTVEGALCHAQIDFLHVFDINAFLHVFDIVVICL
ncbi:hypothetical protein BUALT_Bualt11G0028900 [Buddleja alternifolia]|uniref:40S ribosomal protein S29 n=1 Tax=Buddleja alternifolia TaxID=168488 RepID=A0AAV6WSW7_9LAMI|nr:hypothetical protein BUALT_Bualt11G0028900 [Buddleja alternifolia]